MKRAKFWAMSLSCVLAACGSGSDFAASNPGGTSGQAGQEAAGKAGKSTTGRGGKTGAGGKAQAGNAGKDGGEAGQDDSGSEAGKAGGGEAGQDGSGGTAGTANPDAGGRTGAGGTTSRGGSSGLAGSNAGGMSEAGHGGENSAGHAGNAQGEGGTDSFGGKTSTTGKGGRSSGGTSSAETGGAAGTPDVGMGGTGQGGATGTGGSGAYPPELMGPCEIRGTFACNVGNKKLPLYCNDDLIWASQEVCDSETNCDSTTGICTPIVEECLGREPYDQVCAGLNTIYICGPDLVTVEERTCGPNEACDSALGTCVPVLEECQGREPNEQFCAGLNIVHSCGPDLMTVETRICSANEACDSALGTCVPVLEECQGREPNEQFCTGTDTLHICGPSLLTVEELTCEGFCENDACAAPRCNDSKPETGECNSNQFCTTEGTCRDPVIVDGMAKIPAGTYMMGSENGLSSELPVHSVSVEAFEMDVTEVTAAAYQACVDAGQCTAADPGDSTCNAGVSARSNHPINCVDAVQAGAYCQSVGKRLPTEEEWEYAARGTDGREYPWGSDAPQNQLCWSGGSAGNRTTTCAVGSFTEGASPFGLEDMAGNVREWTSSSWSSDYSSGPTGTNRVNRGGSWFYSTATIFRAASRAGDPPLDRLAGIGFRCAR